MEAASAIPPRILHTQPNTDKIKQNLLKKGVFPTPKIIHTIRKKELQKSLRKSNKNSPQTLTSSEQKEIAEESYFQTLKAEYRTFTEAIKPKSSDGMIGKPWERIERGEVRELANLSKEYIGEKMKLQSLRELSDFLEKDREQLSWILDNDIEFDENLLVEKENWVPPQRRGGESEAIRFVIDRLSDQDLGVKDWKFVKVMKHSELQFTEEQLLKIVEGIGKRGKWRNALSVVQWVYNTERHKQFKSRYVYTKLLSVLGKAQRPKEALQIFKKMRGDRHIYPDMAAYHSIAVTLGQAGLLKELLSIIEIMKQRPSPKKVKNVPKKDWDPVLQPDVVIFNAVLNACVPSRQWKAVSWVFAQLRYSGLKPNGPSYGLAMEVMLKSGKYNLVHEYFEKLKRSGEPPKALTFKVLVKAFWEEGRVNEAVKAVRIMEQIGVVGSPCVYYELACCLCNNARWRDAMSEIKKLRRLRNSKPLEFAFTGMILSCMDGGHIDDCESVYEQSKKYCGPNIGIINVMIKVYGSNDMFLKAKTLFEETKRPSFDSDSSSAGPDMYTYTEMLKASASTLQWEYFEYVYKEMILSGFQIDQSKHSYLLVEASQAGKWNLLEHAFDLILETGEIPEMSLFTEMVCQAIVQEDYERAVQIVNTLAHAPYRISEKQWTELFFDNRDRINHESHTEMLSVLHTTDISTESSVLNLLTSLESLSDSTEIQDSADSISVCESTLTGESIDYSQILSRFRDDNDDDDDSDDDDDNDDDDEDFYDDDDDDGDSSKPKLPSALEILEGWKESMKKDGTMLSNQAL